MLPKRRLISSPFLRSLDVCAFGAAYRRARHAAEHRVAQGSHTIATRRGVIEYAVQGTGPPALVVHGAGGGFDQGLMLSRYLRNSGHRIIAVSRFGYLRTPQPADASAEAQADAHASLMDALELDRVAVIGASAGASSCLQLAIRHPDRVSALVLLVPATYLPGAGHTAARVPRGPYLLFDTVMKWDFTFWLASRLVRELMVRTLLGTKTSLLRQVDEPERALAAAMLDLMMPLGLRRQGLLNDARVNAQQERYALERIRAPTLIVSAKDDLYGSYEPACYMAGEIPGARFIGYESGGHLLLGRSASVVAEICSFLGTRVRERDTCREQWSV